MSNLYYSSSYYQTATSPRHRANRPPLSETAARYANAAQALGKGAVQSSARLAGNSAAFLSRHREGAAGAVGVVSGVTAAYYAYKGVGDHDLASNMRQSIEYYLGISSHAPQASAAGTEVGRSALASCITGFSFLTQLIFRAGRHEATARDTADAELKLDNLFDAPAEMMLPEPIEPTEPQVTLAEVHQLNLPVPASHLYGWPIAADATA
jgi:hypothetical protein